MPESADVADTSVEMIEDTYDGWLILLGDCEREEFVICATEDAYDVEGYR